LSSTEVDNLDLIKLLAGFEQDVLRLQISVNDTVVVAVSNTGKELLH